MSRTVRLRAAILLLAAAIGGGTVGAGARLVAAQTPAPAGRPGPAPADASGVSRKLVASLRALVAAFRAEGFTRENAGARGAGDRFSSPHWLRVDRAGRVQVYVAVADASDATLAVLRARGLDVEVVSGDFGLVQGWIAIDDLEPLATEAVVTKIRPPSYGVTQGGLDAARRRLAAATSDLVTTEAGSVTSEGDAIHRCPQARAAGFDGTGITVGVISDGASGLAASKASGNLPAGAQVITPGPDGPGDEGTAMMEIVHDCAPGAGLLFSGFVFSAGLNDFTFTSLQFNQAVGSLMASGARAVVDDLTFFSEPFFEDGVIALNDRVKGNQIVRVSSAGNHQEHHYQGVFTPGSLDPDGNGTRHNFGAGNLFDSSELLRFRVGGGTSTVLVQWDERFGQAATDYRLCVRNTPANGGAIVTCSTTQAQDGNDDPLDFIDLVCNFDVCAGDLQITRASGTGVRTLKAFCFPACVFDEHNTTSNVVIGYQGVPEVVAVAAAAAATPTVLESYSSNGPASITFPAPEVRPKPDVTGIDCVSTSRPDFTTFCGTSAAAPHVAAIAALVLNKSPALTPAQVRQLLKDTAIDLGPPGFDAGFGAGRADALNAVNALGGPPPPPAVPVLDLVLNGASFRPGQTLVLTFTLSPGPTPILVDAYVVLQGPDGSLFSLTTGGIVPGVVPIARSFTPFAVAGELLRYTFTGSEPAGPYRFVGALTQPGTLTIIGALDDQTVTFGP